MVTRPRILSRLAGFLARVEESTRPEQPDLRVALERRWAELPDHVRFPAQSIGRRTAGCEGTRGVFPRCNLSCTPCYRSSDANRVRVDGDHTAAEVDRQMAYLNRRRGPWQNAQLIGGEVTLLGPDEHARALQTMLRHRRKPMSFTHGDLGDDYLRRLATEPNGRRRLGRLIFAVHVDSLMRGRRAVPQPATEAQLNPVRRELIGAFWRLRREHGVSHYVAHNMTVTPSNVDQVPDVLRGCGRLGFRMFSFQPAAYQGDPRQWRDGYRKLGPDDVWRRIEEGVGSRLPWRAVQVGDPRCNRSSQGVYLGERWLPLLDDRDPRDLRARDAAFRILRGLDFEVAPALAMARIGRALLVRPSSLALSTGWAVRFVRRAGLRRVVSHRPRPVTFVMHRFMDASDVRPAWELLERGQLSSDARVRETQERLLACSYHMAHPDSDRLVPACVQHSVFDPDENLRLAELLPRRPRNARARSDVSVRPPTPAARDHRAEPPSA